MTELTWDGKYDAHGKKQGPVRIALPFQTIETVNESAQDRRRNLELFASGRDAEWRNRLIWGDKKYVLPSLLPEFAGKVSLVYIDPPFDTSQDFSFTTAVPGQHAKEEGDLTTFTKEPSVIEQKAYRDTWGVSREGILLNGLAGVFDGVADAPASRPGKSNRMAGNHICFCAVSGAKVNGSLRGH